MAKTIKVIIGGRDYNLVGDDDKMLLEISDEVNQTLSEIERSAGGMSSSTLAILTALNIAEKKHNVERLREYDNSFITTELTKMAEFLDEAYESNI